MQNNQARSFNNYSQPNRFPQHQHSTPINNPGRGGRFEDESLSTQRQQDESLIAPRKQCKPNPMLSQHSNPNTSIPNQSIIAGITMKKIIIKP
jgi:hypothetical protein